MKFNTYAILILSLGLISCESEKRYDQHQLGFSWSDDKNSLPLRLEISDVSAEIIEEKYTDFSGFKLSADFELKKSRSNDTGQTAVLIAQSGTVDSLYDFKTDSKSAVELSENIHATLKTLNENIQVDQNGFPGLVTAWEMLINSFIHEVDPSGRMASYYQGKKEYVRELCKSLYTFPGRFTKGYTWTDDFSLIVADQMGFLDEEKIIVEWELLRLNEKEAVFFGKGRNQSNLRAEELEDRTDYKRQFAINLVIDRKDNALKRGTIDLREESAKVKKDEVRDEWMRIPISVRNIKIKINPIKND